MTWKAPRDRLLASIFLRGSLTNSKDSQYVATTVILTASAWISAGVARMSPVATRPLQIAVAVPTLRATMRLKWVSSSRLRDSSSLMSR